MNFYHYVSYRKKVIKLLYHKIFIKIKLVLIYIQMQAKTLSASMLPFYSHLYLLGNTHIENRHFAFHFAHDVGLVLEG